VPPDDEHLDAYERWARARLERFLGPLRVTDRKGGPPGIHDFEADLGDGSSVAAVEVTSEVEPQRLGVESEIRRHGRSFPLPGLNSWWSVRLSNDAQVRKACRSGDLRQLLSTLEASGVSRAQGMGFYCDPLAERLHKLGIASVFRLSSSRGGGVTLSTDAYGGFAWQGPVIDSWLDELLTSPRGASKLAKLRRADSADLHLAIVMAAFSKAGLGIPLGLESRHDLGAAEYVMPSFVPPEPLTSIWILPMAQDWEGLRWARGDGWAILSALHQAA
jgi:hypothetical protein